MFPLEALREIQDKRDTGLRLFSISSKERRWEVGKQRLWPYIWL